MNFKTKIITIITLTVILLLSSCTAEKENTEFQEESQIVLLKNNIEGSSKEIEYIINDLNNEGNKVKFSAIQNDNTIHSKLYLKKNNENNWLLISKFDEDVTNKSFQNTINSEIELKAKQIKNNLKADDIELVVNILKDVPEILFELVDRDHFYANTSLSFFWHLANFNTSLRALESPTEKCKCSEYNKNEAGAPFLCKEDKIIDANDAYSLLNDLSINKRYFGKQFIPVKTLKLLKNKSSNGISASVLERSLNKEVENFIKTKFSKSEIEQLKLKYGVTNNKSWWNFDYVCWILGVDRGSDCGCCGNYNDTCYYCAWACYWHDLECQKCDHWWCFSGCVAGPC